MNVVLLLRFIIAAKLSIVRTFS